MVIALGAALVSAGCSQVGQEETAVAAAQDDLLAYLESATGEDGLVLDAAPASTRTPDIFATAWVSQMARDLGEEVGSLDATELMSDDEAMRAMAAVPADWRAWAWFVLADAEQGASTAVLEEAATAMAEARSQEVHDTEEASVRLWVENLAMRSGAASMTEPELRDAVLRELSTEGISITAAQRLVAVCDQNGWSCPEVAVSWEQGAVEDIAGALDLAAAAELASSGWSMGGFDCREAGDNAQQVLEQLDTSDYLLASRMTKVLVACDGDLEEAYEYLQARAEEWSGDAPTLIQYVPEVGSLTATYAARSVLRERFAQFSAESGAAEVAAAALESTDLDPYAQLLAVAILTPYEAQPRADHRARLEAVAASMANTRVAAEEVARVANQLLVLNELGVDVPGVSMELPPVEGDTERDALEVLRVASLGLISNGDEALAAYADYLGNLPSVVLEDGPASPLFALRLRVLDSAGEEMDDEWTSRLQDRIDEMPRCTDSEYLVGVSESDFEGCDIAGTALILESELGLRAFEHEAGQGDVG
ncbi:hypothetical protein [Demequina sp. NBRC 110053]|uniref:hypothetical protein n=1 Tax=Demequina sp. NBRC 110053 TaxID=1570342 RepID=UPI0013563FF6|nr:hypothetical protein [Demequina sp. NBRC 110053]